MAIVEQILDVEQVPGYNEEQIPIIQILRSIFA
jgi:hypothetical protein